MTDTAMLERDKTEPVGGRLSSRLIALSASAESSFDSDAWSVGSGATCPPAQDSGS